MDRNFVRIFPEMNQFLAEFHTNPAVYNAIKAGIKAYPPGSGFQTSVNICGFSINRESILLNRGHQGVANAASKVSSAGYVVISDALKSKVKQMSAHLRAIPLSALWQTTGGWDKGDIFCWQIFYKDSKVSGIIAKRVIDNNHFADNHFKAIEKDAQWRAANNASANPNLINGSVDEYQEIDAREASLSHNRPRSPQINF